MENMKKCLTGVLALLVLFVGCFIVNACGAEVKLSNAYVEDGTLETTVGLNEQVVTDNVVAHFEFSDGIEVVAQASVLTFSSVDTSTAGAKTLKISYVYNGITFSFDVSITVTDEGQQSSSLLTNFSSELLTDYNANKSATGQHDGFKITDRPLFVGDDNPFNFRLVANGIDENGDLVVGSENLTIETTMKVEHKVSGGGFVELTGADLEEYVRIITDTNELDFTQKAANENAVFRVTVTATNIDPVLFTGNSSFSTELTIVDGWNVYDAKDLSLFDNVPDHYGYTDVNEGWAALKQSWELKDSWKSQGVTTYKDVTTNGIILQSDIELHDSDIPSAYFVSDSIASSWSNIPQGLNVVGALRNRTNSDVYGREIVDASFNMYGNYFQVDASKLSRAVTEKENDGISAASQFVGVEDDNNPETWGTGHALTMSTALFAIGRGNNTYVGLENTANIQDVSFLGNAQRSQQSKYSGGISGLKTYGLTATWDNIIYQDFYNGFNVTEIRNNGHYELTNSKGFNCYSMLIFCWGSNDLVVENCELKGAGGPVLVADHTTDGTGGVEYNPETGAGGQPVHVNFINCDLESLVDGKEPWFVTYGAQDIVTKLKTSIGQLLGKAQLFQTNQALQYLYPEISTLPQKTATKKVDGYEGDYLNAIAFFMKDGAVELTSLVNLRGYVRVFNSRTEYEAYYDAEDPVKNNYGLDMEEDLTIKNYVQSNHNYYFQSNTGGYVSSAFDGTNAADTTVTNLSQGKFYFYGDLLNIYMGNGMGAIISMWDAQVQAG